VTLTVSLAATLTATLVATLAVSLTVVLTATFTATLAVRLTVALTATLTATFRESLIVIFAALLGDRAHDLGIGPVDGIERRHGQLPTLRFTSWFSITRSRLPCGYRLPVKRSPFMGKAPRMPGSTPAHRRSRPS